jgi:myo-inositol-1-phosphate synthase
VGNCASSFVQGVEYYKDADPTQSVPGLMHVDLGGYHVRDIEFTAAFDIDADKVGKDLSEAIWSGQNNTIKFADGPAPRRPPVYRGMTHDGLGKYLKEKITKAPGETDDIVGILKDTEDRRGRLLPPGRLRAGDQVVRRAGPRGRLRLRELHPGVHRRRELLGEALRRAGLPIVGDDIKSQVGATIVHRMLRALLERGVEMKRTSQLNVGGNMDFYNMLERERLESKKISKTQAVTSIMGHELPADDVYIGPRTTCRG